MPMITVIGSLNMDMAINAPRVPRLGETILGAGCMLSPGGKGANQAVAAAKLGGRVYMLGCVGDDIFADKLINNLVGNNVSVEGVKSIKSVSSGLAVILIKDGDNSIIVDPGANSRFGLQALEEAEEIIKNSSVIVLQMEIPVETVIRAILIAKKYNVKVILNLAPALKLCDDILSKVDVLILNESECEILTGIATESVSDAKSAVRYLKNKGISQVIVTMGGKGVVYNNRDNFIHKPVSEVEVVDTTAAGDSFTGAIAVALSDGKDIDTAIDFANIVGTLTVTKKGAQNSIPSLEDVKRYIT